MSLVALFVNAVSSLCPMLSGGIFGMFGGQLDESLLLKTNPNVKFWPSVDENPQRRSSYSNEQS